MKIAIFEPELRVCGPVNWAFHARTGFRDAGHECDVVAFTKSGKQRKAWEVNRASGMVAPDTWEDQTFKGWTFWHTAPDVVGKWADAGRVLDGYDLVILTEPRHLTDDRRAKKEDRVPYYLTALDATTTPWTTALHGPQYVPKLAPNLDQVFSRGRFTGVVTTPDPIFAESGAWAHLDAWSQVVQPLPFALRDGSSFPELGRVGITGRAVPNKGHHALAATAPLLPPGWNIELWGAASLGNGPNFAYTMYEHLVLNGWRGERNGKPETVVDGTLVGCEPGATRPASGVLAPYLWWLERDGRRVEYLGGYEDAVGVCRRLAVHVDLTSAKFSHSLLEFVVLEAIDAGSVPVVPRHIRPHADADAYVLSVISGGFDEPPGMTAVRREQHANRDVIRVAMAVNEAIEIASDPVSREAVVKQNRDAVRHFHDPARFAQRWLVGLENVL